MLAEPRSTMTTTTMTPPLDVLVVDDDDGAREVMAMAITSLGHRCRVASSGEAALSEIAAARPDVVISDLEMPGMSGTELCRRLRASSDGISRVYFIVLSGYGDQAHRDAGAAVGVDSYQLKPVDLVELEASLHSAASIWWRATC